MNQNFKKIEEFIKTHDSLCFLSEKGENIEIPTTYESEKIEFFIPLCPDYSFEINDNNERIHDFTSIGTEMGIVYEKFIRQAQSLFDYLREQNIDYYAYFLEADVEAVDPLILKKLGVTKEEFVERCAVSAKKIDADLKERRINGKCIGMEEYFEKQNYDFHKLEEDNLEKVANGNADKTFVDKVIQLRKDLYNFWFGISEAECIHRAYKDIGMYATFAEEPRIAKGIILCADSEILSCSYNCLKTDQTKTPVIYVKGNY